MWWPCEAARMQSRTIYPSSCLPCLFVPLLYFGPWRHLCDLIPHVQTWHFQGWCEIYMSEIGVNYEVRTCGNWFFRQPRRLLQKIWMESAERRGKLRRNIIVNEMPEKLSCRLHPFTIGWSLNLTSTCFHNVLCLSLPFVWSKSSGRT